MGKQRLELEGQRFGRLVAIRDAGSNRKQRMWLCQCDCGKQIEVQASKLKSGWTRSCRCVTRARTHGLNDAPERSMWRDMMKRCSDPTHPGYHNYGGRGIKVCDAWHDFPTFYRDRCPRPSALHTLDRIDNDGDYSPENTRWATRKQQSNNRRDNHLITHEGLTLSVTAWSERLGISVGCIVKREKNGWKTSDILSTERFNRWRKPG